MAGEGTTQQFLEIEQIREGMVILKNKSLRGVLLVSSLNFALKSSDEQKAIIYHYQDFLNSLDFTTQIVVSSRRLNITGYLDQLKELERRQKNELLRVQTAEYQKFIKQLVAGGTIMTKTFFVVVPFTLAEAKGLTPGKLWKAQKVSTLSEEDFQRCKNQLLQRMGFIVLGLRGCGLRATPLSSEELIELFWSLHHPDEAEQGYFPEISPELKV